MIIDSSITVRELLSISFIKASYHVETARDWREALEKLQQGIKYDAIWCDIIIHLLSKIYILEHPGVYIFAVLLLIFLIDCRLQNRIYDQEIYQIQ